MQSTRETTKVKVKVIYGDYCKTGCSTSVCFVRKEQDKIYDAVLTEDKDGHGEGHCRYWSNSHHPKSTHVTITTKDGEVHILGKIRYEIVKDIDKKKSAPKKAILRLSKGDFKDKLEGLI